VLLPARTAAMLCCVCRVMTSNGQNCTQLHSRFYEQQIDPAEKTLGTSPGHRTKKIEIVELVYFGAFGKLG